MTEIIFKKPYILLVRGLIITIKIFSVTKLQYWISWRCYFNRALWSQSLWRWRRGTLCFIQSQGFISTSFNWPFKVNFWWELHYQLECDRSTRFLGIRRSWRWRTKRNLGVSRTKSASFTFCSPPDRILDYLSKLT